MLALIRAVADGRIPGAEVAIVISNVENAAGLERAREHGVEAVALDHRGRRAKNTTGRWPPNCAPAKSIWSVWPVICDCSRPGSRANSGGILNIHPSLLPAFGAQRAATGD